MKSDSTDHDLVPDEIKAAPLTVLSYLESWDCLQNVLDFLPIQDLASFQNASRQFNTLASHPLLWQKFIANQPWHLGKYLLLFDWQTETRSINEIIEARLLEKTSTRIDLATAFTAHAALFQALNIHDEALLIRLANDLRIQASELQANNIYCNEISQTLIYPYYANGIQIMRYLHTARHLESLLMQLVIINEVDLLFDQIHRIQPGSGLSFKVLAELDSLFKFEEASLIVNLLYRWLYYNSEAITARTTAQIHEMAVIEDIFQGITQSDILKAQSLGMFDKKHGANLFYLSSPLLRLVNHLNEKQVLAIVKTIPPLDLEKLFAQDSYFNLKASLSLKLNTLLFYTDPSVVFHRLHNKLDQIKFTQEESNTLSSFSDKHWFKLLTSDQVGYILKNRQELVKSLLIGRAVHQCLRVGYITEPTIRNELAKSPEFLHDLLDELVKRGAFPQQECDMDEAVRPFKELSNTQRLANTVQQLATSDMSNKQAILFIETLADTNENFQAVVNNSYALLSKLFNYYKEQAQTQPMSQFILKDLTISKASRITGAITGALLGGLLWLISYPLLVLGIMVTAPIALAILISKIVSGFSKNRTIIICQAIIIFSIALLPVVLLTTVISPLLACIHLPFLITDGTMLGYKIGLISTFKNILKLPWLLHINTSDSKDSASANFIEKIVMSVIIFIYWPVAKLPTMRSIENRNEQIRCEQISERLQDYHQRKTRLEMAAQHEQPVLDRLALKTPDILISVPSAQHTVNQKGFTDSIQTGLVRHSLFATKDEIKITPTLNSNKPQNEQAPDLTITPKLFGSP